MDVNKKFKQDLKKVRSVVVYSRSGNFFAVTKREALDQAKTNKIHYYITDDIYLVKRNTIVIL